MRRTTLAIILAAVAALAAPAAASALNVYAATSLTNVFPALNKGADVQLRRLEHAPAADRARRSRRRLRVREPDRGADPLQARASAPAR